MFIGLNDIQPEKNWSMLSQCTFFMVLLITRINEYKYLDNTKHSWKTSYPTNLWYAVIFYGINSIDIMAWRTPENSVTAITW